MPHETDMRSARPRIGPPASGREGDAPPVPRSAPEPDGVVDVRTLRELGHDVTMRAASVRLLAGVAARESELDPAVTRRLRQIADEAERVIDICGSFLDPSREAGPSVLDVLAADAAGSARLRHRPRSTSSPSPSSRPPIRWTSSGSWTTSWTTRAGRPGREGGSGWRWSAPGDRARLVVADSGPGFGRGEPGHASLGLGIVGALVRRSGGGVRMGRGDLGGLAVTVVLPAARRSGPGPARPAPATEERDRVIICDAHRVFADALASLLRARGHQVVGSALDLGEMARMLAGATPGEPVDA